MIWRLNGMTLLLGVNSMTLSMLVELWEELERVRVSAHSRRGELQLVQRSRHRAALGQARARSACCVALRSEVGSVTTVLWLRKRVHVCTIAPSLLAHPQRHTAHCIRIQCGSIVCSDHVAAVQEAEAARGSGDRGLHMA